MDWNELNLGEMYQRAAEICRDAGVAFDAQPGGSIHQWVVQHTEHRPGTTFFIVQGIAAAMADLDAQTAGYKDQHVRAATKERRER